MISLYTLQRVEIQGEIQIAASKDLPTRVDTFHHTTTNVNDLFSRTLNKRRKTTQIHPSLRGILVDTVLG